VRPGLTFEFHPHHGCPASAVDIKSPYIAAARKAIATAFGVEPVMIREGGSIPVVATLKQILWIDTLLLGWCQKTDNLHSPNEHFRVEDFHRGIRASAHLWQALAEARS
jgi:acetylornithine deacetylase/succinyl-diaminopimelate desuccinylase-like protein